MAAAAFRPATVIAFSAIAAALSCSIAQAGGSNALFSACAVLSGGRTGGDLDVVARGTAWHRVSEYGFPAVGVTSGTPMALFWDGRIEFSPRWISEEWDTDDLIDRAEIIQGLPFAQLTDVLTYKQQLDRPKDRPDVEALLGLLGSRFEPAGLTLSQPYGRELMTLPLPGLDAAWAGTAA